MLPESHPYHEIIRNVLKPGRYCGGEVHQTLKAPEGLKCRVALAFPDVYEVGMSHMGLKILYSLVNAREDLAAERVFAPWPDMEAELRRARLPLVSLESATPLSEFDLVGFSLQYELTFTNILLMLDLGGIPLRSEARDEEDPLIIAGGPVAFQPEPLAPFIDLFVIGDGEESLPALMDQWTELGRSGLPRPERLARLAKLGPGRYAPAFYPTLVDPGSGLLCVERPEDPELPYPIERARIPDLEAYPFPVDTPVPVSEAIFDRHGIELARGCTEGCRFCQAGMIYRPVRERSPAQLVETVMAGIREGGYDEVSLTSLSTADYSAIEPLVRELARRLEGEHVSLAVSSLRAYGLSETMLDALSRVRSTSLTFAPEAGTQRLRDVVNKNIGEEMILESARRVFSRNWNHMKLYFMIGLPSESDEDVLGIVQTGRRCLQVGRSVAEGGRRPQIVCAVSSFVPKPFTPFQWAAQDGMDEIRRKQDLLRGASRSAGLAIKWHDPRISRLEGVFSRGDRRLADWIEAAYRRGCRFDGWGERFRPDIWQQCLAELDLDENSYLGAIPLDARLPWDHIDCGLEKSFLAREYRRSLEGRLSPPCGKAKGEHLHPDAVDAAREAMDRRLVCHQCGVACDLDRMKTDRLDGQLQLEALSREKLPEVPDAARRYRLVYAKRGPALSMSHLDLLRLWPRLFRRAGLRVDYSKGYHPHPRLSFSPALPMGMESDGEQLEAKLRVDLTSEAILDRLAPVLPDGLELIACYRDETGPMARRLKSLSMEIEFRGGSGDLEQDCRRLLLAESLRVERLKKGARRRLEVRPALLDLKVLESSASRRRIRVDLALQSAAPQAAELVALLGGEADSCRARRLGFRLLPDDPPPPLEKRGSEEPQDRSPRRFA